MTPDATSKHRRRPWIAWLLAVVLPPFYWWYWYWRLVTDLRDTARVAREPSRGQDPVVATLMVSVGAVLVVPMIVSLVQTSQLIRRLQHASESTRRCRSWVSPAFVALGVVLVLAAPTLPRYAAIGLVVLGSFIVNLPVAYLQSHANGILRGRPATLRRRSAVLVALVALPASIWASLALPLSVLSGAGLISTYRVPSAGMEPTFRCGDRFVLESLTRRSRHPRRGDVIAFHPPAAVERDFGIPNASDITYFKRVIGLPGDSVSVKDDRAIVNDRALREPYVLAVDDAWSDSIDFDATTVPEGTYFVLGDHRNNSADSRSFGPIPRSAVIGRVVWMYWPPRHFGPVPESADSSYAKAGPDLACAEAVAVP